MEFFSLKKKIPGDHILGTESDVLSVYWNFKIYKSAFCQMFKYLSTVPRLAR